MESSSESQPSIASIISESSPPSSSIARRSYSPLAKRSHSLYRYNIRLVERGGRNLRVVGELCELVLDCKEVARLIRDEFVQVDEAVEEDSH